MSQNHNLEILTYKEMLLCVEIKEQARKNNYNNERGDVMDG